MRYSTQIKPISYLKANAAEVLRELEHGRRPLVITQNGEAKAVLQDVASYEQNSERPWRCSRSWRLASSRSRKGR